MADRGFDIDPKYLEERGLVLNKPPNASADTQFTEEQLSETRDIAAVRVHVERLIGAIRRFNLFKKKIPISMCPLLEKHFHVCAHLTNFMTVLIKAKN